MKMGTSLPDKRRAPRHPSKVTADDVDKASGSYPQVVNSVTKAVCSQVLKAEGHPAMRVFVAALAREYDLSSAPVGIPVFQRNSNSYNQTLTTNIFLYSGSRVS